MRRADDPSLVSPPTVPFMNADNAQASQSPPVVTGLVPMVFVADIERSLTFYAHLGFERGDTMPNHSGKTCWASMSSVMARIKFALASPEPDPSVQAIILYLYAPDVVRLRERLLAAGLRDGGKFGDRVLPDGERSVVYEVTRPFYMPAGELRVHDPDGYCLLIGQLA